MNTNEIIVHKTRTQNELYLHRIYFAATDWDEQLGAEVFCTWLKLFKRVDRSADAVAKYGNKNTIPFSLARLAELLGKSINTLRKHIRTLWNYGLVDFTEWQECKRLGKKPINVVVYPYPQNDLSLATQQLQAVRDYDSQYEQGNFELYTDRQTILEMSYDPQQPAVPAAEIEAPPEMPEFEAVSYDEYVQTFAENNVQPLECPDVQQAERSNVQYVEGPNVQQAERNNIYNALVNNTNAELIKPNAKLIIDAPSITNANNINNAFNNSSSSFLGYSNNEVLKSEDDEIKNSDIELVCELVVTILETRNVAATEIHKIKKLVVENNIELATASMVTDQLDHMATVMASGEVIRSFSVYFINGLLQKVADYQFVTHNDPNKLFSRNLGAAPVKKEFYNWLEEREDQQQAYNLLGGIAVGQ